MQSITVQQLKEMKDSGEEFQLIDVREENEYGFCHIGGELIPLATVPSQADRIRRDIPVVVMCRSGKRSATAIHALESIHGFSNLVNLSGGILAWADEIDPSVPKY
ncbi:MAG: rhodanese-like domain-containing protein [Blastocatellia bacterium]